MEKQKMIQEKMDPLFYCIDCQEWKEYDKGQFVENWVEGHYTGNIMICNECIALNSDDDYSVLETEEYYKLMQCEICHTSGVVLMCPIRIHQKVCRICFLHYYTTYPENVRALMLYDLFIGNWLPERGKE